MKKKQEYESFLLFGLFENSYDGTITQVDGLDEWDELCNAARCSPGEFQCRDEGNCIPQDWTCDGHSDCTDGSDETVCNVTCSEEEFQCDNSDCIQAGTYFIDTFLKQRISY